MESHDELLQAAIAAQQDYERAVDSARAERREAFRKALRGTVTGRELARETGLSESTISAIKAGKY